METQATWIFAKKIERGIMYYCSCCGYFVSVKSPEELPKWCEGCESEMENGIEE